MKYERQLSQCFGKFPHLTREAARRSARSGNPDPYLCPFCKHWHIGHHKPETGAMRQYKARRRGAE